MRTIRTLTAPAALCAAALLLAGCSPATVLKATPTEPAPTVTVTQNAVPDSCLMALDEADKIIDISAETMRIVQQAFEAAAAFDIDGMNAAAAGIRNQTAKLGDIRYAEYRDNCKEEA